MAAVRDSAAVPMVDDTLGFQDRSAPSPEARDEPAEHRPAIRATTRGAASGDEHHRDCRKVVQMPPQIVRRRFPPTMAFIARLRCSRDGMIPDVRLVLLRSEVDREALRRRLTLHAG